jgi:CubicO group peptidase (beta-lactamase class C family)
MIRRRVKPRIAGTTVLVLLVCLAALRAAPAAGPEPVVAPPDFDAWVQRAMGTFDVPGLALAIVKDDAVVTAKGYGVRRLGERVPVDARTLFGIASNTKAFTATALAILVDEKKIEWDAPVIRYLPAFAMWDPFVTRELTVRDLLVHRSGLGLGAGDLLWWPASTYNRQEIASRLRFIRPATSFRSTYAYDNVLYLVAGEVIAAVSGQSWEDFVSSRILARVGMTGTNVRHSAAMASGNVAATHAIVDGKVRPIAPFDSDNTNPAGGINSSAEDMAKWLRLQLAAGRLPDGTQLISEPSARQLTTIVTPMPFGDPPAELAPLKMTFRGYALGFEVRDYRGHKIVLHTGGLPGYVSRVAMIPDARVGVAVLTNQESGEAFDAIAWHVLDQYLDAPPFDWITGYATLRRRNEAREAEEEKRGAAAREANAKPSLPLERYSGTYHDGWYGDIAIAYAAGRLTMSFSRTPALTGTLEPFQHDTFIVRWRDRELRADAYVTFALNPDGSIDQAKMRAVSPATDFSFDFQDLLLRPASSR